MRRVFLLAALPLAAETPDEILGQVAQAYKSMSAVHVVASIETIVAGGGAGGRSVDEAELEYAAKGAGLVRASRKGDGALMISSGDMTWKALGSKKEYMAMETQTS